MNEKTQLGGAKEPPGEYLLSVSSIEIKLITVYN